jgi:hypothetical protein
MMEHIGFLKINVISGILTGELKKKIQNWKERKLIFKSLRHKKEIFKFYNNF